MHVLQRIAVQDVSKEEAFIQVRNYLENEMGNGDSANSWYDWFVTGGGRWNPNEGSQYNDDDQSMTISYEEDPTGFIEAVDEGIRIRIEEFNRYRQSFDKRGIDINAYLDKYDGQMEFGFELYDLNKMIDFMQGKWDFNSYFFDCTHDTTNTKYMLDSIDKGNKNWYIVFVDFHF